MAIVPRQFRRSGENLINSITFTDFTQNVGYITFYGATVQDTSLNTDYILTTNSNFGSFLPWSERLSGSGTIISDVDFNVTLASNLHVKGTVIVQVPCMITNGNATPNNSITLNCVLYHVNSLGTETSLASITGTGTGGASSGDLSARYQIASFYFENIDQIFKIGETIRLNINTATLNNSGSPNGYIGHDPLNRVVTSSWATSQLKLLIPTRIQG